MGKYKNIYLIIFNIILISLLIIITYINIIPIKYLILIYIGILIIDILNIYLIKCNKKILNIVSYILIIIIDIISIIIIIYLLNTYIFINKLNKEEYIYNYDVIVLNKSNINDISNIEKIGYLDDNKDDLNNKLNIEYNLYSDAGKLIDGLNNKKVDAICIESSHLKMLYELISNLEDNTKIIYSFEITKYYDSDNDILNDSFILYISGIDQYGNVNTVTGRSDVNILAVVNLNEHKVLLINTPRDYYVQLHGTTGLKDKLTHAGVYGINKSIETLEDLYDINIDYYLRINFDTLVKVVDLIGGIDIYSDKAFDNIKYGWNHLNGADALSFSRQRKIYATGDRHRGENQEQVISAIINKVTSNYLLLSKYNEIISSLEGSFQTNMSTREITSLLKNQINNMKKWEIESISVDGSDSSNYTYSMGTKLKLYVMIPNEESINSAKEKINEYR